MAYQQTKVYSGYFQPAAVGSDETKGLFPVVAGDRVLWATVTPIINSAASTNSTISIGDGNANERFVAVGDVDLETAAVGTPVAGTGTGLAASGGYMYTAADTVDLFYVNNTQGATNPKVRYEVAVARRNKH